MECNTHNQVGFGIHNILQDKRIIEGNKGRHATCTLSSNDGHSSPSKAKYLSNCKEEHLLSLKEKDLKHAIERDSNNDGDVNACGDDNDDEQTLDDNNNNSNEEDSKNIRKKLDDKLSDILKKKKSRTVFSRYQVEHLENTFKMKRYLSSNERSTIAESLNLSETQVKIWFQNRRNKWKRKLAIAIEFRNLSNSHQASTMASQRPPSFPGLEPPSPLSLTGLFRGDDSFSKTSPSLYHQQWSPYRSTLGFDYPASHAWDTYQYALSQPPTPLPPCTSNMTDKAMSSYGKSFYM